MDRKKIVIIPGEQFPVPPVNGGAVESLINTLLIENEKKGLCDIWVFSTYNPAAVELSKGFKYTHFVYIKNTFIYKIKRVLFGLINNLSFGKIYIGNAYINEISKHVESHNSDVVISENIPIYTIDIKRRFNTRTLLHCHNVIERHKHEKTNKMILKSVDDYLCISRFIAKDVSDYAKEYNLSIRHLHIFYNCFDSNNSLYFDNNTEDSILKKYGINKKKRIVVFAGRIQPFKGVKELINAFKLIKRDDAQLVIAGGSFFKNSPEDVYVKEMKKLSAGNDNIIFTGFIEHDDLLKIYNISYMAVIPSIWEEPFALTCLEPMACGVPVIISNSGGMVEVIDKQSGYIVNRDDNFISTLSEKISFLLENPNIRDSMAKSALLRSRKFSSDIYYDNFLAIINS